MVGSSINALSLLQYLEAADTLRQKWFQRYKDEEKALISSWEPVKCSKDLLDLT